MRVGDALDLTFMEVRLNGVTEEKLRVISFGSLAL